MLSLIFFFNDTATTEIYTLSLHDALPIFNNVEFALAWPSISKSFAATGHFIWHGEPVDGTLSLNDFASALAGERSGLKLRLSRSEEHTSELQSQSNLVCRLLLEKKNHN